jgi:hypothetical protein
MVGRKLAAYDGVIKRDRDRLADRCVDESEAGKARRASQLDAIGSRCELSFSWLIPTP